MNKCELALLWSNPFFHFKSILWVVYPSEKKQILTRLFDNCIFWWIGKLTAFIFYFADLGVVRIILEIHRTGHIVIIPANIGWIDHCSALKIIKIPPLSLEPRCKKGYGKAKHPTLHNTCCQILGHLTFLLAIMRSMWWRRIPCGEIIDIFLLSSISGRGVSVNAQGRRGHHELGDPQGFCKVWGGGSNQKPVLDKLLYNIDWLRPVPVIT